jgi:hypothetical protein
MKRRSVRRDPINTTERDRGAVVTKFAVDMDRAVPAKQISVVEPSQVKLKK